MMKLAQTQKGGISKKWKRLGIAGFLFFLVKGLVWLFAGYMIFK